jgi:tetratricopeptide (TPR) repeat protein
MRNEIVAIALAAALASLSIELSATDTPQAQPAGDLAALEQRLAVEPDSLEAGNQYRQAVIHAREFDRCLAFFERLVAEHPGAANAHLNYGLAHVDKIPVTGVITQMILAKRAESEFTRAVELRPSWITYYTRGNGYLFWPTALGKGPLGIADLERALELQRHDTIRTYHVRAFISLGDGYWKIGQPEKARAIWTEGTRLFPDNATLKTRLSSDPDAVTNLVADAFDPSRRVDTDLRELWTQR